MKNFIILIKKAKNLGSKYITRKNTKPNFYDLAFLLLFIIVILQYINMKWV